MRKILPIIAVGILLSSGILATASQINNFDNKAEQLLKIDDYDPLVDIELTIDIKAIRSLDKIDIFSDPDFFIKLYINDEEFISQTWNDALYLYDCWSITKNVPDDVETVTFSIQLWDTDNYFGDKICDISEDKNNNDKGFDVNLIYSLKTGQWYGDDYNIGDPSGYGRLCGCGDGSIYKDENDCELFFNIYQNDYDEDGLSYWMETEVYGTDPTVDNRGEDQDEDGVPIEWEHRWGFNPFLWEDHEHFDPDGDSINNTEEYLTSDFGSDPFRKDVFLEMDFMEDDTPGQMIEVGSETFEHLKNPFNRRNIVFHTDTGEVQGGELIPFDDNTEFEELYEIHNDYFLHGDYYNWRRGVFHYGIVVYYRAPSLAFNGDGSGMGYGSGTNSFVISKSLVDYFEPKMYGLRNRDQVYASNFMHELGHNFGFRWGRPFGVDLQFGRSPWQINYWIYGRYRSVMNYRWIFLIQDYSDGSHGRRDNNDWEDLDFSYFERPDGVNAGMV